MPWEFNHLDLEDPIIEEVLATMEVSSVILTDEVVEVEAGEDGEVAVESEEHTSELQSHSDLVCRLLLEKKKKKYSSFLRVLCPSKPRL